MSIFLKTGYEIMQYSICDGWINNLYDGNNDPYVFSSLEEAIAELQEEFDDWQAEIENGDRDEDERYDISSFEIVCNTTGLVYALDIVDRKVIVAHAHTYSIEVGPR
jgi:hypothetical protein